MAFLAAVILGPGCSRTGGRVHEQWAWQAVTHVAPEASQSTAACWVQSGSAGPLPAPPFSSGAQVSHLPRALGGHGCASEGAAGQRVGVVLWAQL